MHHQIHPKCKTIRKGNEMRKKKFNLIMLLLTSTNWILPSFLEKVISSLTIAMKVHYLDPKCQRFSKLTPNSSHPSKWELFFSRFPPTTSYIYNPQRLLKKI